MALRNLHLSGMPFLAPTGSKNLEVFVGIFLQKSFPPIRDVNHPIDPFVGSSHFPSATDEGFFATCRRKEDNGQAARCRCSGAALFRVELFVVYTWIYMVSFSSLEESEEYSIS